MIFVLHKKSYLLLPYFIMLCFHSFILPNMHLPYFVCLHSYSFKWIQLITVLMNIHYAQYHMHRFMSVMKSGRWPQSKISMSISMSMYGENMSTDTVVRSRLAYPQTDDGGWNFTGRTRMVTFKRSTSGHAVVVEVLASAVRWTSPFGKSDPQINWFYLIRK